MKFKIIYLLLIFSTNNLLHGSSSSIKLLNPKLINKPFKPPIFKPSKIEGSKKLPKPKIEIQKQIKFPLTGLPQPNIIEAQYYETYSPTSAAAFKKNLTQAIQIGNVPWIKAHEEELKEFRQRNLVTQTDISEAINAGSNQFDKLFAKWKNVSNQLAQISAGSLATTGFLASAYIDFHPALALLSLPLSYYGTLGLVRSAATQQMRPIAQAIKTTEEISAEIEKSKSLEELD